MNEMIDNFSLFIDYTQILVHVASHPSPGLLWTDDHVAQGFAWSEGIVSFGVPDHDNECLINVMRVDTSELATNAIWALQVPFRVSEPLQIGTIFDTRSVNIQPGQYNIIFEALPGKDDIDFIINLKFLENDTPDFAILKRGGEISTDIILRQHADIAG